MVFQDKADFNSMWKDVAEAKHRPIIYGNVKKGLRILPQRLNPAFFNLILMYSHKIKISRKWREKLVSDNSSATNSEPTAKHLISKAHLFPYFFVKLRANFVRCSCWIRLRFEQIVFEWLRDWLFTSLFNNFYFKSSVFLFCVYILIFYAYHGNVC